MVRDAYPILIPTAVVTAVLLALGWVYAPFWVAGGVGVIATLFIAWFFRDPERVIPADDRLVVSPADGKVVVVEPREDGAGTQVSIFLSVFDVHVNRAPVGGKVTAVEYRRGKFMAANVRRASIENEQNVLTFESAAGPIICKQIAGLIARRIVCWVEAGSQLARGARFGLIKFGSRVDLLLPPGVRVDVSPGDRVKGGESVIGRIET